MKVSQSRDPLDPENLNESLGDAFHRTAKAALGSIPIVGSPLSEIFGLTVKAPIEKRRDKFMLALKAKIDDLEQKKLLDKNLLANNDEFLDILIQAYDIALKNSQEEKIKLLQNAVLNTALGIDIQRDEKSMFLNIINYLTPTHFKVLESWYNSEQTLQKLTGIYQKLVAEGQKVDQFIIPDDLNKLFGFDTTFYSVLLKDLETWNLLQNIAGKQYCGLGLPPKPIDFVMTQLSSTINEHITGFGKRFMRFIMNPPNELPSET